MTDTRETTPCNKCGHEIQPGEIHLCGEDAQLFKTAESELYNNFQGNKRRFKRHLKKMKITQYDAICNIFNTFTLKSDFRVTTTFD